MRINVLGLGNILHTDEGFGVEAVKRMEASTDFDQQVEFIDGGTQGIYLLDYIKSPDRLLIFDAVIPLNNKLKVHVYNQEELPALMQQKISSHETGLGDLLSLAKLHEKMPEKIVLIGVPPQDLKMHIGLSSKIEALMPEALQIAEKTVREWLEEETS